MHELSRNHEKFDIVNNNITFSSATGEIRSIFLENEIGAIFPYTIIEFLFE